MSNALTIVEKIPEEIRQEFYETSRKVSATVLLEIARADTPSACSTAARGDGVARHGRGGWDNAALTSE